MKRKCTFPLATSRWIHHEVVSFNLSTIIEHLITMRSTLTWQIMLLIVAESKTNVGGLLLFVTTHKHNIKAQGLLKLKHLKHLTASFPVFDNRTGCLNFKLHIETHPDGNF